MNDSLFVNKLIKWYPTTAKEYTERVLWVENDGSIVYAIDIYATEGFPVLKNSSYILDALSSGDAIILEDDPLLRIMSDEDINEKDHSIRDKAWEIISEIVKPENEPDIFLREKRGPLISKAVDKFGVTYNTVYKYLRKYWQRGKNKNSLLSDYCNSGGKGKSKRLGEKKIGRPRKNALILGAGINVDDATKKIFRIVFNKYYNTEKENYVTTAYNLMLKEFYAEDYIFEDGYKKSVLIPAEQIPTVIQFRYWLEKENNLAESIKKRKGKRKYLLDHRAVLGKSDSNITGPGCKYQIDATIADIYLKSRYNKDWIIGRPIVYVVVDVFSRIIVGVYVGLEGPSWIGAMMALANAFSDKVEFCKEYEIDITEQE